MSCPVQKLLVSKIANELDTDQSKISVSKPIMTIGLSSVVMLELVQETIDELKYKADVTKLFSSNTKQEQVTILSVCEAIKKTK